MTLFLNLIYLYISIGLLIINVRIATCITFNKDIDGDVKGTYTKMVLFGLRYISVRTLLWPYYLVKWTLCK